MTSSDSSNKEYERHNGDWHEWSIDITDPVRAKRLTPLAQRLFVRIDSIITITESYVTSGSPEAREVDGGEIVEFNLTSEQARWLRDTLTKALVARGSEKAGSFRRAAAALRHRASLVTPPDAPDVHKDFWSKGFWNEAADYLESLPEAEEELSFKEAVVQLAKERAVLMVGGMMIHPNTLLKLAGEDYPARHAADAPPTPEFTKNSDHAWHCACGHGLVCPNGAPSEPPFHCVVECCACSQCKRSIPWA